MDAVNEYSLRPLGIGEIFDRAVTIYVRNFVPFTLMMLTLLVPYGIARIMLVPDAGDLSKVIEQIGKPGSQLPASTYSQLGAFWAIILVVLVLTPFVTNAVAVGVAGLYTGQKPTYARSFGAVFGRWAPLLGTAILNLLMLFATYLVVAVALVIFAGIGIALVSSALPVAVVIFVIAGIALLAYLLFLMVMIVAYTFSMYGSTIEKQGVLDAIGTAYGRVFSKTEIKKSTLVALAFFGLSIGVSLLSATVELLLVYFLKNNAIAIAIQTGFSAVFSSFTTILLAVYYYDVRTRAEGLDLETDLNRLTAQ